MSTKRKYNKEDGALPQKEAKLDVPRWMEYSGYSLQQNDAGEPKIAVEDGSISAQAFFEQYIGPRRPCVIDTLPKLPSDKAPTITLSDLTNVAGDKQIQVERRYSSDEAFGQNRTSLRQLIMTVAEFVKNLEEGNANLYLSTQDTDSDDPFQAPCRELLDKGHISDGIPWAGNLVLHSCNLWMGASNQGSSSGLHHDFHDNFYLLLRGRKRFRLYSPDCAPNMYTHGDIERVFSNGVISYVGNETRSDGVPLAALETNEHDDIESDDDDEEEGVFFGNGSDDAGDYSDEDEMPLNDDKDDYDEIMGLNEQAPSADRNEASSTSETSRPNSFSKIDLRTLQDPTSLAKKFPQFPLARDCIADLKEGQTLYLPAGWFHEVTSQSSYEGSNHTALNYWFHPPDSVDHFEQPYQHSFWKEHHHTRTKVEEH